MYSSPDYRWFLSFLLFFVCIVSWCSAQRLPANWHKYGNNTVLVPGAPYGGYYFTTCNSYTYFAVYFYYPCNDLLITILPQSGGSPEMYVSRANLDYDPYPTREKMTWEATKRNYYQMTISYWDTESAPGWYYIGIYNDCSQQNSTAWYQIQTQKVDPPLFDTTYVSDPSIQDLVLKPLVGRDKTIQPNAYTYYRFCVPTCSNVQVSMQTSSSVAYPEIIVSRTEKRPSIQSLGYKFSSKVRGERTLWINASDPSGRDRNGNQQGTYYIAVHGSCPPSQFDCNTVNANMIKYSLDITLSAVPGAVTGFNNYGRCPSFSSLLPTEPTSYASLASTASGYTSVVTGTVTCTSGVANYTYYRLPVPDPCVTVNFLLAPAVNQNTALETGAGTALPPSYPLPAGVIPEIVVGRYPNIAPKLDRNNLAWTGDSVNPQVQNLTITPWDPNFDGGFVCGKDSQSECSLYVGVTGVCGTTSQYTGSIKFVLSTTVTPSRGIISQPQLNQKVPVANGVSSYRFCASVLPHDLTLQLKSYVSACNCPDQYALYDVLISKYNPNAGINDLVWRIRGGDATGLLQLPQTDADTRPGAYYVNVLGTCTALTSVPPPVLPFPFLSYWDPLNMCASGPCANLPHSPYGLYVDGTDAFNAGPNGLLLSSTQLPCKTWNASFTAGAQRGGTCAAFCPSPAATVTAPTATPTLTATSAAAVVSTYLGLSDQGKIAIAVVVVLVVLIIVGCCLWRNRASTFNRFHPDGANLREHHDDDGDHEEDMGNNFDLDDVHTVSANKSNSTTLRADTRKTFHAQSISL